MARPKKIEGEPEGQLMSSADIIWMRVFVITGLSNLETGVRELRRTYITYFNSRLPEGHPARVNNVPFFPAIYAENGGAQARAITPAQVPAGEGAQKRKRKPHDPNAPKRALTSYFLFMQDHKPAIKEDHPDWTAAQISAESERRWENISEEEKADYDLRYQVDLCRYYKQKEAYENGEPIPEISPEEAQELYREQVKSGQPPKGRKVGKAAMQAHTAAALPDGNKDETSSSESEEDTPPPKAVSPPRTDRSSKRQKIVKEAEAAKASSSKTGKGKPAEAAKVHSVVVVPVETDKKKKGSKRSKVSDEVEEVIRVAETSPVKAKGSDKKGKSSAKKRKSAAVVDDD